MSAELILAIDQGTTNTKAIAIRRDGRIAAQALVAMEVTYPRAGWAEQSAESIWSSVRSVIDEVVAKVGAETIIGIAISNQRESIVLWDAESGKTIGPCVIWQCRRSAERCAALRDAGYAAEIEDRTGLALDPLFPAAKIAWLIDEIPGARQKAEAGTLRAGTVDAWLLWNFTAGAVHATDHSNASRTQLFSTRSLMWDEQLGALFDVPIHIMPRVLRSDSRFGETAAGVTSLPAGVPIHAMMGDSHAALYGHGVRTPGTVKATYGTGSSLMTLTAGRVTSTHGLSGTIAWSTAVGGVAYALEGNISVSGQAAAFMAEMLGLDDAPALAALAETVEDTNGVAFVPALVGLGAPYWRDEPRGLVSGLSLGTKPAHLARAAVEAIAFQVADVFDAMTSDLGTGLTALSVDGGASRNDMLMQFQADMTDCTIIRGDVAEVSAVGAASMAASGLGWGTIPRQGNVREFRPRLDFAARTAAKGRWKQAIRQALTTSQL
jgi:glycerol kinase